jgi:flagellar biosynthetic protein FliO
MVSPVPWMTVLAVVASAGGTGAAGGNPTASSAVVANRSSDTGAPGTVKRNVIPPELADAERQAIARPGQGLFGRDGERADAKGSSTWQGWLSGLLPLAVVLAAFAGLVALTRRYLPRSLSARLTGGGIVEVLARQHLSPKQSIALIKVGRRVVLVGVTPDRLSCLDSITDPDEVASVVGRVASGRPGSLTSTFQNEVLREATAYASPGFDDTAGGPAETHVSAYRGAGRMLRSLTQRVRALTVSL